MLDFQIDPVAFTIPVFGGLEIYWYGILIVLGMIIGVIWAAREIDRRNQSVDELYNGVIVVVFAGYFFARLTYVLLDVIAGNADRYGSLLEIINVRAGGVNIVGGFFGAALVGLIFVWWRRLKFWHFADVAGPALLIAQSIGRWGNFINQELYGPPTDLPWGITIEPTNRLAQYRDLAVYPADTLFHPTFLYESITLFVGFVLLVWLNHRYREQWKPGTLFGLFLIWWAGNRAWIEFFRPDQPAIGNSFVTYSMLLSLVLVLVGVWVLLSRYDRLPEFLKPGRRRKRRTIKPKPKRDA